MTKDELLMQIHTGEFTHSFSKAKNFYRSPRHFVNRILEPADTAAMVEGTILHLLVFEPEEVENQIMVFDKSKRPNPTQTFAETANKNWKRDMLENPGTFKNDKGEERKKEIVENETFLKLQALAEQVRTNEQAGKLIRNMTSTEEFIKWKMFGKIWRGKIDGIGGDGIPEEDDPRPFIVDLKKTVSASPFKVKSLYWRELHHSQLVCYRNAKHILTEKKGIQLDQPFNRARCFNIYVDNDGEVFVQEYSETTLLWGLKTMKYIDQAWDRCVLESAWDQSYEFHHGRGFV